MTFITEYIPKQDFEKYGLWEINEAKYGGHTGSGEWTIDRERGIYIRAMWHSREEPWSTSYSFYWKGAVLRVEVSMHAYEGEAGGKLHITAELMSPLPGAPAIWLPPELESQRMQITHDFKASYVAEKTLNSAKVYTECIVSFI